MRSVFIMMGKEFREVFRTRVMLAILFVMPVVQTLVLGFAITNEVTGVTTVVCDMDHSQQSHALVRRFGSTKSFHIVEHTADPGVVRQRLESWDAMCGLVIPAGFGADLHAGRRPQVSLVLDGIDGNTAGVAAGYAQRILAAFAADWGEARLAASGRNAQGQPLRLNTRMWYNPDLDNAQYMVPGIVVILVTITTMLLSSMALVREKEIGTLEQLMVTPLGKWQLLAGKVIPFLALGFAEMFVALAAARFVFGLHIAGSVWHLVVTTGVYIFTTLGLGILISTRTATQQQAMFFSWFGMIFLILLSGLFIPIANMPASIRMLTAVNPMRYFIVIVREITLKGSTLGMLHRPMLVLAGYGAGVFGLGVAMFRKRVG